MTTVQQRILIDFGHHQYLDWAEHRDMIGFTVPVERFLDYQEEEDENFDPGFTELLVIVEKDYLFGIIEKDGYADPRQYLKDEYSSEDAIRWYDEAMNNRKIAMVSFN